MAEILTKLSSDFKSNTILGFCIALILYVANGIRISLGNSLINDWPLTELLINYQGGFVRRGIFGEIVFNTANPITSTTLLQKFALIFCLIGLIGILIYQSSNLVRIIFTTIVVFAPGGLHDMKAGGDFPGGQWEYLDRKEIWFYSALIIFYFSVKWFSNRPVLLTGIFTTISVIMILHHELFVFFALILFTVLLISKKTKLRSIEGLLAGVFYFFVSITFYLVYKFHGDGEIAYIIWYSYQDKYSEIVKHFGGVRPTVSDRRPLLGTHEVYKSLHILNGLGTRGVMLGPAMAKALYDHIENNIPLDREADIKRFHKRYLKSIISDRP